MPYNPSELEDVSGLDGVEPLPEDFQSEPADVPQMDVASNANAIVRQLRKPRPAPKAQPEEDEEEDVTLSVDIEARLNVAKAYQVLLASPIFDDDTPATRIVRKELTKYIRSRLKILVGLEAPKPVVAPLAPPPVLPFDDREILALKALAASALGAGIVGGPESEPEKKRTISATPAPKPIAPKEPGVRRIQLEKPVTVAPQPKVVAPAVRPVVAQPTPKRSDPRPAPENVPESDPQPKFIPPPEDADHKGPATLGIVYDLDSNERLIKRPMRDLIRRSANSKPMATEAARIQIAQAQANMVGAQIEEQLGEKLSRGGGVGGLMRNVVANAMESES